MKRRALLGTIASLAVAGCTNTATERTTTTRASTATTTTSTTQTTTAATPPELRTLGVPATQTDLPLGDEGRAVSYPDQSDEILSLTPVDDELDLPADATTFTLANDTDHEYRVNFYDWSLSKRENGQWFHIAPQYTPDPLHVLPAGETRQWSFAVDNEQSPVGGASSDQDITLAGLGGGEYAFTLRGWFPLDDADESFQVAVGAAFWMDGGPVALTPTDDVSASRDGDTVVVTYDEQSPDDGDLAALVVERSDVPPDRPIRERITEQLLRPGPGTSRATPFRNTIPYFEDGVETVRLEAHTDSQPPFVSRDEPFYLGYEDETYRVSTERPE